MNSRLILEQMIDYNRRYISEEFATSAILGLGIVAGGIILLKIFSSNQHNKMSAKRYNIDNKQSTHLREILTKRIDDIDNADNVSISELKSTLKSNGKYDIFKSDLQESYNNIKNYSGKGTDNIDGIDKEYSYSKERPMSTPAWTRSASVSESKQIKEILKYLLTKFK